MFDIVIIKVPEGIHFVEYYFYTMWGSNSNKLKEISERFLKYKYKCIPKGTVVKVAHIVKGYTNG